MTDKDFGALPASPSVPTEARPEAVVVPRLCMKTAIAEAIWKLDLGERSAARVAMVKAQDILTKATTGDSVGAEASAEVNQTNQVIP